MAKILVTDTHLTNIANAIRDKKGETIMYKPSEMCDNINTIENKDLDVQTSFIDMITNGISSTRLTKLPNNLTHIRSLAFGKYKDLALTKLPDNLTNIEPQAFQNCTNLALTELPSGLTAIQGYTFEHCTKLALTELPSGITSIGNDAFENCINITLTKLPSGLTNLGSYSFRSCSKLAITELPVGITKIQSNTFYSCGSLTEITCLGNITSIASNAFQLCSNLAKFVLPNVTAVPTVDSSSFLVTSISKKTGYIYVPDTLVDEFKSATNWSAYADQIKPISELPVKEGE